MTKYFLKPRQPTLADARIAAGFSQEELAEMLGTRRDTVSAIENGLRPVTPERMMLWSDVLGLPVSAWVRDPKTNPLDLLIERLIKENACDGVAS